MSDLRQHLQEHFGLDDFRPAQREVIEDVLRGRDVLCVMPTGAGKSLCYQLPSVVQKGLTIVVSPLISLMEDQVQQMRDEGIPAAMLNSSMSPAEQRQVMGELHNGFGGLLYVAPERFFAANFQPLLEKLKPNLLAVDEAHCISQWGHDFRPEYARLGEVRNRLGNPATIALTATATEDVREDIIHGLSLREPNVVVTGFDRTNLIYESRRVSKVADKERLLLELVQSEPGSSIVYCATRKAVDELTMLLSDRLRGREVFPYHAGMDAADRTRSQESFMGTAGAVAVATNAFGMGINKPDIRLVVHYNLPGTLEAYYQEAGRAGRDGQPSRCVILFSYQDRYTQEFFIDKIGEDNPNADPQTVAELKRRATRKLELVLGYAGTHRCRRQMILDYFGDPADVEGCQCDVCRRGHAAHVSAESVSPEVTTLTRQILSAIARLRGRFGVGVVAEVLTGATNERLTRWGLDRLSVYGLLRAHTAKRVVAMLHRVIESGLARQRDPDRNFRPVVELTPSGVAVMKGEQPPPATLIDLLPRPGLRESSAREPRERPEPPESREIRAARTAKVEEDESQLEATPEMLERFERLRSVRLDLARERQLPPYCICHDRTLKLIARMAPQTEESLEQIKGMGPFKVRMYGAALLEAVKGSAAP